MTIPKPDIPGTVIRWIGETAPRIAPSVAETVAIPIVHDWGPVASDPPGTLGRDGGLQLVTSFAEFVALFGDSDTEGRTAVAGAFAGEGLPGRGGAGAVLVCRMAGASKAKAAHTFVDRQGTPADGLRLTAKYYGARGNNLSVTIDANPSDVTQDRLRIMYLGAVRETYVYSNTDLATLAASINRRSSLVTAEGLETGQRLAAVTGQALTGGDSGLTLTGTDHLNALAQLEFEPFGVISPYNLTDSSVLASYVSWVQSQAAANRPVRLVVGGPSNDTIDTALTRTTACADEHVVNFGVGQYHDDLLDKDLSTAQLAPRVAGILAAKGQKHALTYAKLAGITAVSDSGPSVDDVQIAVTNGVVVAMQVAATDTKLRIAKGVTTFTNPVDPDRPLDVFSDARLIGVMDNYVRNMKMWGDEIIIGDLPVNDDTRLQVYGHARQLQDDLLRDGLILPGDDLTVPKPFVVVDDPGDPSLADAIPYRFGWQFARTANAILGEGHIR